MMRQVCTEEHPYVEGANGLWSHPQAILINGEYYGLPGGGDYETYECPVCKLRFRVTLPD
jgi:hypothetical protein